MTEIMTAEDQDLIFRKARTHNGWLDKPVSRETLEAVYALMKHGPTSANSSPARIVFLTSKQAKEPLIPHLSEGNTAKTIAAPVTAIIGYDLEFYAKLGELFPHNPDAASWFSGDPVVAETTAFRNGTLQGAYLIVAARALGLDCGAMSGFDNAGVDRAFFPDGQIKSNFLCNLGYGDWSVMPPKNPRLSFDAACRVL